MKSFYVSFLLLFVLTCSLKNNFSQDKKNIEQLIEDYNAAFDQKDFIGVSKLCTEDFQFFTLDGQTFDKNSIIPFLNRILNRWKNIKTTVTDLEIQLNDKIGFARYKAELKYQSENKNGVMHNLVTMTFRKINKNWMIDHIHMSTAH